MVLDRPPTALWVLPVGDLGGVARHAVDVARTGIPGWRVVFVCPPGPVVAALRRAGGSVRVAPFGPAAGLPASVRSLRRAVREVRPALVHTHLAYADVVAALAVRERPLVSTEHGIAGDGTVYHRSRMRARARAGLHHLRLRRVAAVIAVSRATAAAVEATWRPAAPVVVVPNGVDAGAFAAPPATEEPRVLALARLAPEKGLPALVDAFALLLRERPGARLTLAGTGPLAEALRQQARPLGDRVDLPGHLDATEALARHDVLVQLSTWENCSYSLLDAAARGLGVVATPVGGNPEILPPRCLVDADRPAAIARAIAEQAALPALRPGLADWPGVARMTQRIGEVYAEVVV